MAEIFSVFGWSRDCWRHCFDEACGEGVHVFMFTVGECVFLRKELFHA